MIQLIGLFLIIIALKLVVNQSNSPIAMSVHSMLDTVVADDSANVATNLPLR